MKNQLSSTNTNELSNKIEGIFIKSKIDEYFRKDPLSRNLFTILFNDNPNAAILELRKLLNLNDFNKFSDNLLEKIYFGIRDQIEFEERRLKKKQSAAKNIKRGLVGLAGAALLLHGVTSNDPGRNSATQTPEPEADTTSINTEENPTSTDQPIITFSPTTTPSPTFPATNTEVPTETPTNTSTPEPTNTLTNTYEPRATNTSTAEPTETTTEEPTETATKTLTQTFTPTEEPTETQTSTSSPTHIPTETKTPTSTPTQIPTNTIEPSPTNTATPSATETPTSTPSATNTATSTYTATVTNEPSPTNTLEPLKTSTNLSTLTPQSTDNVNLNSDPQLRNCQVYRGQFNVVTNSTLEENHINIVGRGEAYLLHEEKEGNLQKFRSSQYGDIYVLPGLDFGVGGVNFDPLYNSIGDIVGLAGDWTLSWDNGPRYDEPQGPWKDVVLFDQDNLGVGILDDGTVYQKVKFMFTDNPDGVDHRELIAAKIEHKWVILSMRAFDRNGNFVNEYKYNRDQTENLLRQIDLESAPNIQIEQPEPVNNNTYTFVFDYDIDQDGVRDSENWINQEIYVENRNIRRAIVESIRQVVHELFPGFNTINLEAYTSTLYALGKSQGDTITLTDIKKLVIQKAKNELNSHFESIEAETENLFQSGNYILIAPVQEVAMANLLTIKNGGSREKLSPEEAHQYLESFEIRELPNRNIHYGIDLNFNLGSFIFNHFNYEDLLKRETESLDEYMTRMGILSEVARKSLSSLPKAITLFGENGDGNEVMSGLDEMRKVTIVLKQINPDIVIGIDYESPNVDRIKGDPNPINLYQKGIELTEIINTHGVNSNEYSDFLERIKSEARIQAEIISYNPNRGGVDVIYGPVVDLNDPHSQGRNSGKNTHKRHISENPDITVAIATAYIQGMNEGGIRTVVKHAPIGVPDGVDAHTSNVIKANLTYEEYRVWEELAENFQNSNDVMITHVIINSTDQDERIPGEIRQSTQYEIPASVNPYITDFFGESFETVYSDGVSMTSFRGWLNGNKPFAGVMNEQELKASILIHAIAGSVMLTDTSASDTGQIDLGRFLTETSIRIRDSIPENHGQKDKRSEIILHVQNLFESGKLFDADGKLDLSNFNREDLSQIKYMIEG